MKNIIPIIILTILVNVLIIWDLINTEKTFKYMNSESSAIYETLLTTNVQDEDVKEKIENLNKYWTKHMDTLCISISRKDLQPVSDQLQFLKSSVVNNDQETAITYSLLLKYNLEGLYETSGFNFINIL